MNKQITRAEQIARRVVCRANDIDPEMPDETIEELFSSYEGERAVTEVRDALLQFAHECIKELDGNGWLEPPRRAELASKLIMEKLK